MYFLKMKTINLKFIPNVATLYFIGNTTTEAKNIHPTKSKVETLLRVHISYKFKFSTGIETICIKADRKLNAVLTITNKTEPPKMCIIMNAFLRVNSSIFVLFRSFIAVA